MWNFQQLRTAKSALLAERTPNLGTKVALVWINASMEQEMDAICRLQILEGVLGFKDNRLSRRGRRGLIMAQKVLTDMNPSIDPSWFDMQAFDLYKSMRATAFMVSKNREMAEDALQNFIMGLSTVQMNVTSDQKLFRIGLHFKDEILSGEKTPENIKGPLLLFLKRFLFNSLRDEKRRGPSSDQGPLVRDDEATGQIEDPHIKEDTIIEILTSPDPLGQKLRNLMKEVAGKIFRTEGAGGQAMNLFADIMGKEHRVPSVKEIAEQVGVSAQSLTQATWQKFWPVFFKRLQVRSDLLRDIHAALEARGIDPQDADPDALFKGFRNYVPRTASLLEPHQRVAFLISHATYSKSLS